MKNFLILVVNVMITLASAAQTPNNAGPIAGPTSTCAGASATYAVAPITNATSYMWNIPAGATITSGYGTNQITLQLGTSSGDIMVFGQNGTSFGNGSMINVTVNAAPTVSIVASPADVCAGVSSTLTASSTATSYSWSNSTTGASIQVTPTATTTYTCTVSNGTCQGTGSVTVNVHAAPNASLNLTQDKACHDIASLQLTGGSPLGGTYSSSGTNIVYGGNVVYPPIQNPGTWTITYTVTDAYGCTGSANDLFSINDIPVVTFDNIGGSLTVNSPDVDLNNYVMPQGGTFSGPGTTSGSSIFSFKTAGAGTHMLTYTYEHPITGCTATQIQYVTIAQGDSTGNGNGTDGINETTEAKTISIYPNPTTDVITVNGYDIKMIQIFDLQGKIILSGTETTISMVSFPAGIYMLKAQTEDGNIYHAKVIKN